MTSIDVPELVVVVFKDGDNGLHESHLTGHITMLTLIVIMFGRPNRFAGIGEDVVLSWAEMEILGSAFGMITW